MKSPRERTRAHLAAMLAVAALGAESLACAGGTDQPPTDGPPPPRPQRPTPGYGVVDPLPPPPRSCDEVWGSVSGYGYYHEGMARLQFSARQYSEIGGTVKATGATLHEVSRSTQRLDLEISPDPGVTEVAMTLSVGCTMPDDPDGKAEFREVAFDVSFLPAITDGPNRRDARIQVTRREP
ncbi:MAG: hypothetical protein H6738_18575 [Alphaproteobacteria bacterium]|nr:hypothetical protein [Alphaproteobacteria bacterium]